MMRSLVLATALTSARLAAAAPGGDPAAEAAKAYALDTGGSTGSVKVGEAGKLVLAIRLESAAWHVHPQAPLKLRFAAAPGLKLEKADFARRDAVDPKAEQPRFEAPFVGVAAGPQEAKAMLDFFICSDTACVKQTRTVAIKVAVR